jgi:hypothetical protein
MILIQPTNPCYYLALILVLISNFSTPFLSFYLDHNLFQLFKIYTWLIHSGHVHNYFSPLIIKSPNEAYCSFYLIVSLKVSLLCKLAHFTTYEWSLFTVHLW